jgi:hypothetical protein
LHKEAVKSQAHRQVAQAVADNRRHCHVTTAATQKFTLSPFSSRSSYGIPPVHCFSSELAQCSA